MKDPKSFTSDVPANLLHGKSEDERWLYNQQSIQRQMLEHIFSNQLEGDNDRAAIRGDIKHYSEQCKRDTQLLSGRIEPFEKLKEQWTGKRALISFVGTVIFIPVLMLVAGAYFYAKFAAHFAK